MAEEILVGNRLGRTPTFIIDTPASEDAFGGHARLAKAIVDVVRNDHRVKTIGILGGWGSGKSTVVRLVEDALKSVDQGETVHCFTYDAWLHQSDPPRRSFLEALATFFEHHPGFEDLNNTDASWRKKVDELNTQTEKNRTVTTPKLTKAGGWYVFALLFVPLGLKLIGDGVFRVEHIDDPAFVFVFVLGWVFALLPVALAGAIYLAWRPWGASPFTKQFWLRHSADKADQSILSVIANKAVETKLELKAKSPEPTAIEFQAAFRDMMAAAQTPSRQMVIVVDNLDRLPPQEAIVIWATIRSFFLGADGANRELDRSKLPTVIMPIDEKAIGRIYRSGDEALGAEQISGSFIEKTFDLVFHVSAPVLSRWHTYLRQRLSDVFGKNMPEDWPHFLGTVYEDWLGRGRLQPTPRSINAFVNATAATQMHTTEDDMHIGVVAYFALHRGEIAKGIQETLQADLPMLDSFDVDWRRSVAALHYGVRLEEANELFMDAPIRQAISKADGVSFSSVAAIPGFERYFLQFLEKWPPDVSVFSAAKLFDGSASSSTAWRSEVWRALRQLAVHHLPAKPFVDGDSPALRALISSCTPPERPTYLTALATRFGALPPEVVQVEGGGPFAEAAGLLIEEAINIGLRDFTVKVPGGAQVFAGVIRHHTAVEILRALEPGDSIPNIIKHLAERLRDPLVGRGVPAQAAAFAMRDPDDIDWSPVIEASSGMLNSGAADEVARAAAMIRSLRKFVPSIGVSLGSWGSDGTLQSGLNTVWQSNQLQAVADIMALSMTSGAGLEPPGGEGWSGYLETEPELPGLVYEALQATGQVIDLEWLVRRYQIHPVDVALLQTLVAYWIDENPGLSPAPATIISNVKAYVAVIPSHLRALFWGGASEQRDFWSSTEELSLTRVAPIFHAVIGSDINKSHLGKALQKRLNATAVEDWRSALRSGDEPLPLIRSLDSIRSSIVVGPVAVGPLRELLPEVVSTEDRPFQNNWFALVSRLSGANRKTLFKVLRDAMIGGGFEVVNLLRVFEAGGDAFLEEAEFVKRADPSVVHLVLPLLETSEGRMWLTDHFNVVSTWIAASDSSSQTTFREQVEQHSQGGEPAANDLLIKMAR